MFPNPIKQDDQEVQLKWTHDELLRTDSVKGA